MSDYLIEGEDYEVSGTEQGDNIPCTLLRTIEPYLLFNRQHGALQGRAWQIMESETERDR